MLQTVYCLQMFEGLTSVGGSWLILRGFQKGINSLILTGKGCLSVKGHPTNQGLFVTGQLSRSSVIGQNLVAYHSPQERFLKCWSITILTW